MTRTIPGPRALQGLRQINADNLMHRAVIERATRVPIPAKPGRYADVWSVVASDIPCRMNPASVGGPSLIAEQRDFVADWMTVFAWSAVVMDGDRLLVRGQDDEQDDATAWNRLIAVRRVIWPRGRLVSKVTLCTDVALEPAL